MSKQKIPDNQIRVLRKALRTKLGISAAKPEKKQAKREKVEDEVRYHREINSQAQHSGGASLGGVTTAANGATNATATQPDSSVFESPQPSSTEHGYGG